MFRKSLRWTRGLNLIFISSALMMMVFAQQPKVYQMPQGFFTPILAFEFAQNSGEVLKLFTSNGLINFEFISRMSGSITWDFLLLSSYSALFFSLFMNAYFQSQNKIFKYSAVLSVLVFCFDIWENILLLDILNQIATGFQFEIALLPYVTWMKWVCFPLIFCILSIWWWAMGDLGRALSVCGYITLILAPIAIAFRSILNEIFCGFIYLEFLLIIVFIMTKSIDDIPQAHH